MAIALNAMLPISGRRLLKAAKTFFSKHWELIALIGLLRHSGLATTTLRGATGSPTRLDASDQYRGQAVEVLSGEWLKTFGNCTGSVTLPVGQFLDSLAKARWHLTEKLLWSAADAREG
ncbi:hypothetical protein [Sinorhizobium fredii]|uniref:hypothetical protein n=1 Tax=Rhizobium fredii TaxID=380 RepID=UPI00178C1892|nr:hypothetical protein [Sinorhizobium fredii]WOS66875.1 hypothetical protein SFGR64A_24390 [Sinorhizobium fredii GR64]